MNPPGPAGPGSGFANGTIANEVESGEPLGPGAVPEAEGEAEAEAEAEAEVDPTTELGLAAGARPEAGPARADDDCVMLGGGCAGASHAERRPATRQSARAVM